MSIETRQTRWGAVHHSSTCKDDWANMQTRSTVRVGKFGRKRALDFTALTLQGPALRSVAAIEKDLSKPWKKFVVRATGTIRTCELQRSLWRSDPKRYAHPDVTMHTQGLAIDVHTSFLSEALRKSFLAHGWHQARPVDEPWHFSFVWTA